MLHGKITPGLAPHFTRKCFFDTISRVQGSSKISGFLSHDAGGWAQFVKYGVIGVLSTLVQTVVFYVLAATWLLCLGANDWAVRYLGLPAATGITDGVRACRFAVATAFGFIVANVFCWLMNRWFVFKPGKYRWYVEFGMFFGTATLATVLALGTSSALIRYLSLMTTIAVFVEVVVSFFVNFFIRKFCIFKR